MLMLMYLFTDFAVSLALISVIIYLFIPIGDILLTYAWNAQYWNNSQTIMCDYLSYVVSDHLSKTPTFALSDHYTWRLS